MKRNFFFKINLFMIFGFNIFFNTIISVDKYKLRYTGGMPNISIMSKDTRKKEFSPSLPYNSIINTDPENPIKDVSEKNKFGLNSNFKNENKTIETEGDVSLKHLLFLIKTLREIENKKIEIEDELYNLFWNEIIKIFPIMIIKNNETILNELIGSIVKNHHKDVKYKFIINEKEELIITLGNGIVYLYPLKKRLLL